MKLKYVDLISELLDIKKSQKTYKNPNVIATHLKFIGIYVPTLKKLAKKYKEFEFIGFKFDEYYETNFIYAYANLLKYKNNVEEQIKFIFDHEQIFECWAIVDSCAPLIQKVDKDICLRFIKSKKEFIIRFGYVILLGKVRRQMMINDAFNIIIKDERYYVKMAEGWLISECLISSFYESYNLLKDSNMSNEIKFIAIQKALDSFRVNDDNKNILREYRKFLKGVTQ